MGHYSEESMPDVFAFPVGIRHDCLNRDWFDAVVVGVIEFDGNCPCNDCSTVIGDGLCGQCGGSYYFEYGCPTCDQEVEEEIIDRQIRYIDVQEDRHALDRYDDMIESGPPEPDGNDLPF